MTTEPTIVRRTGSVKLERGENNLRLPVGSSFIGFDATGSLRMIWEAPGDILGEADVTLHVVPVGEEFTSQADGFQVIGMATPAATRPVVVYQTWNFPKG